MTVGKVQFRAASHMEGYLDPTIRRKRISGALNNIRIREANHGDLFDTIAYRGASGAIIASIIAHRLKKPLLLVRKPDDTKGHSPFMLEGPRSVKRYLIVDDFMSSGATYEAIRAAVRCQHPQAECIGMLEVTYAEDSSPSKAYRFSREHQEEIERETRVRTGMITAEDIALLTLNRPIAPVKVFEPVYILKDGDTFKFQFKEQKFLPKPVEPEPTDYANFYSSISKLIGLGLPEAYKAPIDKLNVFRQIFGVPVPFDYEQKAKASPEAAVSAATEG